MVNTLNSNERFTGQHAILKFSPNSGDTTYEITMSNVSWSRDIGTTDVQHNDNLKSTKAVTDIRFSGSFEYNGQNFEAINAFLWGKDWNGSGTEMESSEPARGTLTVKETDPETGNEYVFNFKDVVCTSQSRDIPSSDSASTTLDWEAEDLHINKVSDGSSKLPRKPDSQVQN